MKREKKQSAVPVIIALGLVIAVGLVILFASVFGLRYTTLDNGVKFLGRVSGGVPVKGTAYFADGEAEYDLETRTLKYENGDVYVGEVKDLVPDGEGTFTWASGDRYEGTFA